MNTEKQIWVLEDDPGCRFVYDETLGIRYTLKMFESIQLLRSAAEQEKQPPDLIIADLRLPGESFLNFLSSDDAGTIAGVPLFVVSSVDDIDALRLCFDFGALDYLTKPFGKAELIVKIERIFEGVRASRNPSLIQIDPATLTVSVGDASSAQLTSKEFQIVALLNQAPSRCMSRQELVSQIWGGTKVGERTLDVHICNLRRKLEGLRLDITFLPPMHYRLRTFLTQLDV